MMLIGACLASSGFMRYLGPLPLSVFYFGKTNHWAPIMEHVPTWLVPATDRDDPILVRFFEGSPAGWPVPWAAWVRPLLAWTALFLALYGLQVCLAALFRRPWVEAERLSFPLVQLPLEMARAPEPGAAVAPFFRSPLMWLGFGLVTVIHTVNGFNAFYPSLPAINRTVNFGLVFTSRPWSAIGIYNVEIYFSVIGMVYLLPTEVAFSLWFFYLLSRITRVIRVAAGFEIYGQALPHWDIALNIGAFMAWGAYL